MKSSPNIDAFDLVFHQAFIALGKDPEGNGGDIIFIAEFGEGDVIPRLNRTQFLRRPPQEFTGNVALSVRCVDRIYFLKDRM